jgi:hypothetical protein
MFFDTTLRSCHTEDSIYGAHYGKEAYRADKAYRQEGLGETPEVHDLHVSHLQEANQELNPWRPLVASLMFSGTSYRSACRIRLNFANKTR